MRIEIDFSDRMPFAKKLGWLSIALSAAGLITLGIATYRLNIEISTLERALTDARKPVEPKVEGPAFERAMEISSSLSFPWDKLFEAFEVAGSENVLLTGLTANANDATCRVTGAARDMASLLAYAEKLRAAPVLSNPQIVQHELDQQAPALQLRFEIRTGCGVAFPSR